MPSRGTRFPRIVVSRVRFHPTGVTSAELADDLQTFQSQVFAAWVDLNEEKKAA